MKKRIFLFIFVIVVFFVVTGCDKEKNKKDKKTNYKSYVCKYTKDENYDGKRYLTKYIIELNSKKEAEIYTVITGFYNYGSKTDGYNEFCNGLKDNIPKDTLEKYKDAVDMKVVCDDKNNYEAYVLKEYQVKKIKDIEEFSTVYNLLADNIKKDGSFDLDAWKNYFNTDSLKAGNYTCDF